MAELSAQERLERAREIARQEHQKIISRKDPLESVVASTPMTSLLSLPNLVVLNRIYIGSIQFDVSEAEIQSIFSVFGPVRNVNMMVDAINKRHKGYGFVEFETPEAAAMAQADMDGSQLAGRAIKVGRPSNFPSDLPPGVPRPLPNRIYVSNVHELISETELRAIFEAFGPLEHCSLIPDANDKRIHKGYAYVEFKVIAHAIAAVQALHGFELAGRQLKVSHTVIGGTIPAGMSSPKTTTVQDTITSTILLGQLDDYEQVSRDKTLLSELKEDIGEECAKFGTVVAIRAALNAPLRDVQVAVQFASTSEAVRCHKVMDKRWFGGRQINAIFIPNLQ